jgi:hypothetical protein
MIPDPNLSISVTMDASFKATIPFSFTLSFSFDRKVLVHVEMFGIERYGYEYETHLFLWGTGESAKNSEWTCVSQSGVKHSAETVATKRVVEQF